MFSAFNRLVCYTLLLNISVALNVLPRYYVHDLTTTEAVIRNCTNSLFANLKLAKPLNVTKIEDFAKAHRYFLTLTIRDSDDLTEIARLTRVDYKSSNNSDGNLTTILNELLDENSCEYNTKDVEHDASVVIYIDQFLAKLEELKESYGVNKVFADINSNIVKIFRNANELYSTGKEFTNSTEDNDENFTVLDSREFWVPSGRRIYRGKRTKIKYFPFMASIQIFNTFQCAGSIIKSDLIITASSCLQLAWNNRFYRENPAFLSVRVGSSFYNSGGENIPVLEIYFHPDYNPKTLRNNICVMRLLRHIKFRYRDRRKVQKIAIDKNPWNLPIDTPGITIVGWGAKGKGNRLGSPWENILSYAILDVYPLKECQEVYSKEYVTMKNFCGGFFSKGSGACNRDVGAPGVVDGILVGVVSFGSPVCGTPDVPTVFTKLGYYYRWIQNIMKMDVPRSKKRTTLEIKRDPFAPYMTTPYTTTTFKIEPLFGEAKPMPAVEENEEDALRMLDNKLFQDFLKTMFDDKNSQKYQFMREGDKPDDKKDTKITREKQSDNLLKPLTVEKSEKSTSTEDESDSDNALHKSITAGYESERGGEEFLEHDFPVTKQTPGQQLYHETKSIPVTVNTENVARNIEINHATAYTEHINKLSLSTTDSPQEILLELATESSDGTDDSDQFQSHDISFHNVASIKEDVDKSSSEDISDVPGKEAIAELLDEIDLQQILEEVSDDKNTSPKIESPKSIFINAVTTLSPKEIDERNEERKKNYKNSGRQGKDRESVLTLLYLSDSEKKNDLNSDSGRIITIDDNRNNFNNFTSAHKPALDNSIYSIVPKSKVYKIISEVIKAAIEDKNNDK